MKTCQTEMSYESREEMSWLFRAWLSSLKIVLLAIDLTYNCDARVLILD